MFILEPTKYFPVPVTVPPIVELDTTSISEVSRMISNAQLDNRMSIKNEKLNINIRSNFLQVLFINSFP